MAQLHLFELPEVDEQATKQAVIEVFNKYRRCLMRMNRSVYGLKKGLHALRGPSMSTTMRAPDSDADLIRSSQVSDLGKDMTEFVERMAGQSEQYKSMMKFVDTIEDAVSNLPANEQEILERTIMQPKEIRERDKEVMDSMDLGNTAYYETKGQAYLRVAFALQIEVYEKPVTA